MKTHFLDKSMAVRCARVLAHRHGKQFVYVTRVVSGEYKGQFVITPDRLSEQSQQIARIVVHV